MKGANLRKIGAEISRDVDLQPEKAPAPVERDFGAGKVVAALRIAEKMLPALADPGHRAPGDACRDGAERIFAIDEDLGAEAPRPHPA